MTAEGPKIRNPERELDLMRAAGFTASRAEGSVWSRRVSYGDSVGVN